MINKEQRKYILTILFVVFAGVVFFCLYSGNKLPLINKSKFSIKNNSQIIIIHVEQKGKKDFLIIADVFKKNKLLFTNSWPLKYDVFNIDTGDINNDNSTDILVGVIKSTRFDPVSRKRLFIFKLFEGYIRPLWLGSRVSQPLVDFKFINDYPEGKIRTIESEKDGSCLVAEYHWIGFGLGFMHYLAREISIQTAYKILNPKSHESKSRYSFNRIGKHQFLGLQEYSQ
jgi:hypothetical protein